MHCISGIFLGPENAKIVYVLPIFLGGLCAAETDQNRKQIFALSHGHKYETRLLQHCLGPTPLLGDDHVTPNRVNRTYLTTKENRQEKNIIFWFLLAHGKIRMKMPQMRPWFFPTNQGLAKILGKTDLHSENFYFWIFLDSGFPDFQIPGFQDSRLSARDSQRILRHGSAVALEGLRN